MFNYLLIFFNNIPIIFKTLSKEVFRVNLPNLLFHSTLSNSCNPEFKGTVDLVEAKIWLKKIKKTYEIVGVEWDKKTIFNAYMLNGKANYW